MLQDDASEADSLARLEAALNRIAEQTGRQAPVNQTSTAAVVAARLDVLIGQLRDALAAGAED